MNIRLVLKASSIGRSAAPLCYTPVNRMNVTATTKRVPIDDPTREGAPPIGSRLGETIEKFPSEPGGEPMPTAVSQ
jgi:hypothetical protein